MMIKIVLVSMLAVCAMGMDIGAMMGGLGGLGGMLGNAKDLLGNIDMNQIGEMMKNLKPGDLSRALENVPPEMMQMVQSLGISKEQMEDAVQHLPEHMDELKSVIDNGGLDVKGMMKKQLSEGFGLPQDGDMSETIQGLKEQTKEHLKDLGFDLDNDDTSSILPKVVKMLKKNLKESGIELDLDQPENIKSEIKNMILKQYDLDENATPEEIKSKLKETFKENLGEMGADIDFDKPEEAFNKVRGILKEQGLDIKEGATQEEVKEAVLGKIKAAGIDLSNPMTLIPKAMELIQNFLPQMMGQQMPPMQQMPQVMRMPARPPMMRPPMMRPRPHQMMPEMPFNLNLEINVDGGDHPTNIDYRRPGPPARFPKYLHGAEHAIVSAYGDEDNVVRHVMNAHNGISSGVISEEAVEELLQDLMHYRLKARILMAKNQMLEEELMRQQMAAAAPPSPFLQAVLAKLDA